MSSSSPRRPGILNSLALFSFILSFLNVIWIVIIGVVVAAFGGAGWLAGPVVGMVATFVALLFITVLVAQSLLSVLLFVAAWKTWGGRPSGRTLHLIWAWITLVFDLLDLALTFGIDGGAWVRLFYAAIVIIVMNRDDVRAYFGRSAAGPYPSKAGPVDDWS